MPAKTSKEDLLLYQRIPKCYVKKKYKQGIKIANRLISNSCSSVVFCKTLAWKALFWGLLGKPDIGMKNIRKALETDNQSSLCWHVYGKLETLNGNFEKAVERYQNALAIAPNSVGVTKDLAMAQVQIGDMNGFKISAGAVLRSLPRSYNSWITFAVASHITGNVEGALNVLHSFQSHEHSKRMRLKPWELSELLLYYNQLLQEVGDVKRALTNLLENRHKICDSTSADEFLIRMYIQSDQCQEAVPIIQSLINNNPNNNEYYHSLFTALRLKTDSSKADILEQFLDENPNALTPNMLFLKYSTGKKFVHCLSGFMKRHLSKGSVNLFTLIKFIMNNHVKKDYIASFLSKHRTLLNKKLHNVNNRQTEIELFSNLVCTSRMLDNDCDHIGALDNIKKAIAINPLASDAYVVKARILKHLMNPIEACRAMEKAQRLEPDDRWLEMKLVKYLLRADLIEEADKLYKQSHINVPKDEIVDSIWYLQEKASTYKRLGQCEKAIELCHTIDDIINEIETSNFEMHTIGLEKSSLRAYEQFVETNKNLRKNKFYLKAAAIAVEVAIQMQDVKLEKFRLQRRKVNKKVVPFNCRSVPKKFTTKTKSSARGKTVPSDKDDQMNDDSSDSDIAPPKNDPNYFQDHLLNIRHFLRYLQTHASNQIETQLLSYEVYSRLRRPLLMMQSLLKARKIDKDHHALLLPTTRLYNSLVRWGAKDKLPQKKLAVLLEMGRKGLWRNRSMEELTNIFLRKHGKDLLYLLEGAKALYSLHPSKKDDAIRLACYTGKGTKNVNAANCSNVLKELKKGSFGPCSHEADLYRKKCSDLFKQSTAFDIEEVKKIKLQDLILAIKNRESTTLS